MFFSFVKMQRIRVRLYNIIRKKAKKSMVFGDNGQNGTRKGRTTKKGGVKIVQNDKEKVLRGAQQCRAAGRQQE